MIKVSVKTRNEQNKIEFISFVVASTKSKNIAYRELEEQNTNVYTTSEQVQEFYLDRDIALEKAKELSKTIKDLSEKEQELFANAIISALEIGCIVKRIEK